MRFGELLEEKKIDGWQDFYVDYNRLKVELSKISASKDDNIRHKAEYAFKSSVQSEFAKVNRFFLDRLTKLKFSLDTAVMEPTFATHQGWVAAADSKGREIAHLEEYAYVNYEGFRKILKKHDKLCRIPLQASFMIDLQHSEVSFWKLSKELRGCVDGVVTMYERGGRYKRLEVEPVGGVNEEIDYSEGGVKKAFMRKNHKFWVPRHRFYELMCRLSAFMPLYYFGEKYVDPLTTSVYLDNDNMDMYSRRLRREDGATLIRVRVYGDQHPNEEGIAFIERKTHGEKIYGEKSKKERFQVKEKDVDEVIRGGVVTLFNAGKRDGELAEEVSSEILAKGIRPFISTRYYRSVFQKDTDDRLRISVDSQLTMTKEFHILDWCWSKHISRIPSEDEYHEFPFVVMELKLRDVTIPEWFLQLERENLVMDASKFSKFAHSCVVFRKNTVPELPYWVVDNPELFGYLFDKDTAAPTNKLQPSFKVPGSGDTKVHSPSGSTVSEMGWCGCWGQTDENVRHEKVDPKLFLANERTFLNWNQQANMLSTFGTALLTVSRTRASFAAGMMMLCVGMTMIFYTHFRFYRRWQLARTHGSGLAFLDKTGPIVLTVALLATFLISITLHLVSTSPVRVVDD